jgi:hypothetical protein
MPLGVPVVMSAEEDIRPVDEIRRSPTAMIMCYRSRHSLSQGKATPVVVSGRAVEEIRQRWVCPLGHRSKLVHVLHLAPQPLPLSIIAAECEAGNLR